MKKNFIVLLVTLVSCWGSVSAQKEKFKALFIYNFTKNVEWPTGSQSNQFVIGVIGSSAISSELQTIGQTQKVGTLPIKVVNCDSPAKLDNCQLVYLASGKTDMLSDLLTKLSGKGTLVVADGRNLAAKGAGISFIVDGEKLKFEICRRNIVKKRVKE
jgi:hypothetical protein